MAVRSILFYLSGCFTLTLLLVVVKFASLKYQLPFEQVLFLRQFFIVLSMLPFMIKDKFNPLKAKNLSLQLKRHGLFCISTLLWYNALMLAPVNDVIGISSIAPVIGAILAIVILKETPKKGMFMAFVICLIGSLIIKKPTFNKHIDDAMMGYIFAIFVVLIRGYIAILNKKLTNSLDIKYIMYFLNTMMMLFFAMFFYKFKAIPLQMMPYILFSSAAFFIEYFLINIAYKNSSASLLQPLDFSKPIFSILLSYLILSEQPSFQQIAGVFVILIGYLYLIVRNKK
jgi:drug/metabolite transporter (DMT)-like permease